MTERKRLMLIDDDPDFVAGIRATLDAAGYETEVAYNPRDGFAALKARPHDLLILDIMMGRGAEGVMMARKVRHEPELRDLPILVLTGIKDQIAFMFPGRKVDPDFAAPGALLEKPVDPDVLLERVGALLHEAESRAPQGAR